MRMGKAFYVLVLPWLLTSTALVAAPLKVELLDSDKNIQDTWKLDGDYHCKWDGSDLLLGFADRNESNALSVRIAGLKSVLGNASVVSATVDLEPSLSDVTLTNQYKFQYSMTPQSKQYEWLGSRCAATINAPKGSPMLQFAVSCSGLTDKEKKLSGLMNFQAQSAAFYCPRL
jgi:hypothetical protein